MAQGKAGFPGRAEIASALDHFEVPETEKQEVLAAIVARKDEVVSA